MEIDDFAPISTDDSRPTLTGDPPSSGQATQNVTSWTMDWGRLLRIARQVAGMSLTALSAQTGLSKGYLSKLESGAAGAANPSRATLAALARALPSFRPLAHTLEPGTSVSGVGGLDFGAMRPETSDDGPRIESTNLTGPIQLGWRDLEALLALLALEAAATPVAITAPLLARALDRETSEVTSAMDHLVAQGIVASEPPTRPGGFPNFQVASDLTDRIGVGRIGDLLVLAAALIAGGSAGGRGSANQTQPHSFQYFFQTRAARD